MDDISDEPATPPAQAGPLHGMETASAPRAHSSAAVLSLKQAMRRARFDDAERASAVDDLRAARLGRLEVLREALTPLLDEIPAEVDCFDVGIMPGSNPRLFIDMIGFVEMGRDPRVYHFVQDTRHGRIKLADSEAVPAIVEAITHYVARRLLERDKALAADGTALAQPAARARGKAAPGALRRIEAPDRRPSAGRIAGLAFAFLIDVLGSIAFFSILAFAAWIAWANLKP